MSDTKFEKAIQELHKVRETSGVDINGKLYSMVKDRVELFRKMWGAEYGIITNVDYRNGFGQGSVVVASAQVVSVLNGNPVASGHAMSYVGADQVSRTSSVEATETAAIGRALACFGLHGGEFASGEEMQAVPRKQAVVQADERKMVNGGAVVKMTSGLFVPEDDEKTWARAHDALDRVLAVIETVPDKNMLAKYWSELAAFRKMVDSQIPDRMSELRAAFQVATKNMERMQ